MPGRHEPDPLGRQVPLQRNLVVELVGAELVRLVSAKSEVEKDRLHHPAVDDPFALGIGRRFGHAELAAIESPDDVIDGRAIRRALPRRLDPRAQLHPDSSQREKLPDPLDPSPWS